MIFSLVLKENNKVSWNKSLICGFEIRGFEIRETMSRTCWDSWCCFERNAIQPTWIVFLANRDVYFAHVIEQPNFRIPNTQYLQQSFVYLIFCMIQKMCFTKKINKKVNKPNIWNSENWLFGDMSKILKDSSHVFMNEKKT